MNRASKDQLVAADDHHFAGDFVQPNDAALCVPLKFVSRLFPLWQYTANLLARAEQQERSDGDISAATLIDPALTGEFFESFGYGDGALTEIDRFFRQTGKIIIPLTVDELLNEQIARKLA